MESLKKRYANNPDQMNRKMAELLPGTQRQTHGGLPSHDSSAVSAFCILRRSAQHRQRADSFAGAAGGARWRGKCAASQWLWVHNLWQPDSGLAGCMPSAAEF